MMVLDGEIHRIPVEILFELRIPVENIDKSNLQNIN